MFKAVIGLLSSLLISAAVSAAPLVYNLKPTEIAENTWLLQGKLEDFNKKNGGNIINTAFIVTGDGVVVFETGPSLRYGKEMRAAIEAITDEPIKYVFNMNHHPDHFLGNQAFSDTDILSLPETGKKIAQIGDVFAENMYRLVGDWMRSTEVFLPSKPAEQGYIELGKHRLKLMEFIGHSGSDLVILDETTGVLYTSGMVFYERALTTPSTPGLDIWIKELKQLKELDFTLTVPAHGLVVGGKEPFNQTLAYLEWLDTTLTFSAKAGMSMNEVMRLPIDERFKGLAVVQSEYVRSVAHLYQSYEDEAF